MQIASRLERNNDALIEGVQTLSKQIKIQTVREDCDPLVSPIVDLTKDAEKQTLQPNSAQQQQQQLYASRIKRLRPVYSITFS